MVESLMSCCGYQTVCVAAATFSNTLPVYSLACVQFSHDYK